jgi:hypothetical protein
MQSTYSEESYLSLKGHGLEDILHIDEDLGSPVAYFILVIYDGVEQERIFINDMFGYRIPVDNLFNYHKRFVENKDFDKIIVSVSRVEPRELLYVRNTK